MSEVTKIVNQIMDINTYVVWYEGENEALVIDPSFDVLKTEAFLEQESLKVTAILLTHGHFDHIAGVERLRKDTGAPVYIHEDDAYMLGDPYGNFGKQFGLDIVTAPAEHLLKQEIAEIGRFSVKVLSTPGHTNGSVCYFIDEDMFTGDTLFNLGIGRTDLDCSSWDKMKASLEKIALIEGDYNVYPGHGTSTTLKYELDNNPFLGDGKWSLY
ncbi:MAG: MBL fold metallo-hydrolase [Clostridia bacterium]|nr:MBL fold metallo-hydrolase [Clostridia bacterium]MBQ5957001.1 MBL fold metallo-hydrolase [Clostridia bacterium]